MTLADGEDERGPRSSGPGGTSSGWSSRPARRMGEASADRGGYLLGLADYEATIAAGNPSVPQPDASVTQYIAWRFTADPAVLAEAADRGSLCARIFLGPRANR